MSYATLEFLALVLLIFILYYICPKRFRYVILLLGSIYFYFCCSKILILYILFSTLLVYIFSRVLNKYKKKSLLCIFTLFILSGLLIFKYNNFIVSLINPLLNLFEFNIPYKNFIMPIGISYFTLDMIAYLVDIYHNKFSCEKNYSKLLLFFIYFPKIVEGPFCKYDYMYKQLFNKEKFNYDNFKSAWVLIGWGLFKKLVIADRAGLLVDTVFKGNYNGFPIVLAIILYTIQIYADFSGCIDIISGVSELYNVKLPTNFKRPFFSKTIQEFWQRWHITLGNWLKEYIFYPISLSKMNMKLNLKLRKIKNKSLSKFIMVAFPLFFVWFINGIWHGPSFKFILYGLYYYILMMIGVIFKPVFDKINCKLHIKQKAWYYQLFQILRTLGIVCIGLFLFRCDSTDQFITMFKNIFTFKNLHLVFKLGLGKMDCLILFVSFMILFIVELITEFGNKDLRSILNNKNFIIRWIVYLLLIFSIVLFGIYGKGYEAKSFIYGGF